MENMSISWVRYLCLFTYIVSQPRISQCHLSRVQILHTR